MSPFLLPATFPFQLPSLHFSSRHSLQPLYISKGSSNHHVCQLSFLFLSCPSNSHYSFCARQSSVVSAAPLDEGPVSVVNFEDFFEKDWSFLDSDESNSKEHDQKIRQIISAGRIEETSRVLVSIGSEGFVDQLVDTSPCSILLLVHDSLFLLACIKEKYDKVKCWQGELVHVPEKWARLDVVFLYFLPALPFQLDDVLEALAKRCSPGNHECYPFIFLFISHFS